MKIIGKVGIQVLSRRKSNQDQSRKYIKNRFRNSKTRLNLYLRISLRQLKVKISISALALVFWAKKQASKAEARVVCTEKEKRKSSSRKSIMITSIQTINLRLVIKKMLKLGD